MAIHIIDDEQLILEVQSRPAIYDKNNKNYCNRDIMSKLWTEIGATLDSEPLVCKTRWVSLRDYFLRKRREKVKLGLSIPGRRKWHLYDNMSFLVPYITNRETSRNLELPGDDSTSSILGEVAPEIDESESELHSPGLGRPTTTSSSTSVTASVPPRSFKRKRPDIVEKETLDSSKEIPHNTLTPAPTTMSPMEHFFQSCVPCVSKFDEMDQLEFQRDVQDLIIKYARRRQARISHNDQYGQIQRPCDSDDTVGPSDIIITTKTEFDTV